MERTSRPARETSHSGYALPRCQRTVNVVVSATENGVRNSHRMDANHGVIGPDALVALRTAKADVTLVPQFAAPPSAAATVDSTSLQHWAFEMAQESRTECCIGRILPANTLMQATPSSRECRRCMYDPTSRTATWTDGSVQEH